MPAYHIDGTAFDSIYQTVPQVGALRAEIKAAVDQAADEADAQPAASTVNLMAHIYAGDPVVLGTPLFAHMSPPNRWR
jgi:TPP-dependent pyruvate/acetoin dehydrogenase alpha subunit